MQRNAKVREAVGHTVPAPRTAAPGTPAASSAADAPVLALRGAAVRLAGRTLWSGVDLRVGAGEFVAVLGPNGAGKSTLIKVLLGLLPGADGEVRVLGARPGRANHRIGYLPQRRSCDPSMRIRGIEVVGLGLDGDRWGVPLPSFGARRPAAGGPAARRRGHRTGRSLGVRAPAHQPLLRR